MPRVTVVVAARDAAATLPLALRSVHAQSFADWDLIVVDDGSTDATGEIAGAYGALVIRHARALGPAAARNRGAAATDSELLAILDADDEWLPDFLAAQVAALDADPGAALAACDARLRTPDGTLLAETWAEREGAPDTVTLTSLLTANTVFSGVVIRRDVFARLGGYAEDMVHAEDYDLWLRLTAAGHRIVTTSTPLVNYRLSVDGLSAQPGKPAAGAREAYDRALRRGGLTARQRRIAQRQRRLHALVARRTRTGRAGRVTLLPWSAFVALEHPERWRHWLRRSAAVPLSRWAGQRRGRA